MRRARTVGTCTVTEPRYEQVSVPRRSMEGTPPDLPHPRDPQHVPRDDRGGWRGPRRLPRHTDTGPDPDVGPGSNVPPVVGVALECEDCGPTPNPQADPRRAGRNRPGGACLVHAPSS